MPVQVFAVDQPELKPMVMPDRFRHDVIYFVSDPPAETGIKLGEGEYFVQAAEAREIYDSGVIRIVSPLDSASSTEFEISEEQELWLEWLLKHEVQHIRLR